ncbi:Sodium/hydrogen exchanger 9B2 [Sparganum proliferum]
MSVGQCEGSPDPDDLLRDSKAEATDETATDQIPLASSLKHRGVSHCLPTLPEGQPLNMSNKEGQTGAPGSGAPWRIITHFRNSPAGGEHVVSDAERGNGSGWCACCRRRSPCCRKNCIPPALIRVLLWIYEKIAGLVAYAIFFILIFACLWIFTGKEALPPKCVEYKRTDSATHAGLRPEQKAKPVAVCDGGRALNILIFYAFAVMVGQLTELIRLPGLVGQCLCFIRTCFLISSEIIC